MSRKLNLEHIAKIEGHAKLYVKVSGGQVKKVEMRVLEGARVFEGILLEKKFNELSHISSRICGVCSVAHTISAISAVENAFNIKVSEQTRLIRELLTIGGTIQSHALHLYFLTLPDYVGVGGAMGLMRKYRTILDRALRIKRLGNNLVFTLAGRDVHPISCVVGGFSTIPAKENIDALLSELKKCKNDAVETAKLFLSLSYPEVMTESPHFALSGGSYFYSDKIVRCEGGACFSTKDYKDHFKEYLRPGSVAEFVTQEGKSYFVGALARVANNFELLSDESKEYAKKVIERKDNPFMNVPAQAIEILEGVNRAIDILSSTEFKPEAPIEFNVMPCACEGISAYEAPRGILFHNYSFDSKGYCTAADITTPTSQNLQHMEATIKDYLQSILGRNPDEIKQELEKLIRAYDPCISCSTHFLQLEIEEE